jgi:hypothetical protein
MARRRASLSAAFRDAMERTSLVGATRASGAAHRARQSSSPRAVMRRSAAFERVASRRQGHLQHLQHHRHHLSTVAAKSSKLPAPAMASVAVALVSALAPCAALAAGFAVGGSGGVPEFGSDETVEAAYATADLAVDLASPLAAYWVVTKALRQEIPTWLNAIIFLAVLGAVWVCVSGNSSLDAYLS